MLNFESHDEIKKITWDCLHATSAKRKTTFKTLHSHAPLIQDVTKGNTVIYINFIYQQLMYELVQEVIYNLQRWSSRHQYYMRSVKA